MSSDSIPSSDSGSFAPLPPPHFTEDQFNSLFPSRPESEASDPSAPAPKSTNSVFDWVSVRYPELIACKDEWTVDELAIIVRAKAEFDRGNWDPHLSEMARRLEAHRDAAAAARDFAMDPMASYRDKSY
jgi:hypothetical protein